MHACMRSMHSTRVSTLRRAQRSVPGARALPGRAWGIRRGVHGRSGTRGGSPQSGASPVAASACTMPPCPPRHAIIMAVPASHPSCTVVGAGGGCAHAVLGGATAALGAERVGLGACMHAMHAQRRGGGALARAQVVQVACAEPHKGLDDLEVAAGARMHERGAATGALPAAHGEEPGGAGPGMRGGRRVEAGCPPRMHVGDAWRQAALLACMWATRGGRLPARGTRTTRQKHWPDLIVVVAVSHRSRCLHPRSSLQPCPTHALRNWHAHSSAEVRRNRAGGGRAGRTCTRPE